jgi:hypothetical protein
MYKSHHIPKQLSFDRFPTGGIQMSFRKFPRHILIILLTTAVTLTACNVGAAPSPTLDVNAINTAIVGTTIAQFSDQFTQTALAAPPTNSPAPTDTPIPLATLDLPTSDPNALPTFALESPTAGAGFTQLPSPVPAGATQATGDACNNNVFEADITILDGSTVTGGDTMQKVWKVRNTGTCTWDEGYELIYIGGTIDNDNMRDFEFQSKDSVAPGEAAPERQSTSVCGLMFPVPRVSRKDIGVCAMTRAIISEQYSPCILL